MKSRFGVFIVCFLSILLFSGCSKEKIAASQVSSDVTSSQVSSEELQQGSIPSELMPGVVSEESSSDEVPISSGETQKNESMVPEQKEKGQVISPNGGAAKVGNNESGVSKTQTPENHDVPAQQITVSFTIDSSTAAAKGKSGPAFSSSVTLSPGATALDALRASGISADVSGGYVAGIGNLYEKDCGSMSGWLYAVNGHAPNVGCGSYTLNNGDSVLFIYTCNMGKDVGYGIG